MQYTDHIIAIVAISALCAGWVAVQLLARRMKTKNHFDNLQSNCGSCNCGDMEECTQEEESKQMERITNH